MPKLQCLTNTPNTLLLRAMVRCSYRYQFAASDEEADRWGAAFNRLQNHARQLREEIA